MTQQAFADSLPSITFYVETLRLHKNAVIADLLPAEILRCCKRLKFL